MSKFQVRENAMPRRKFLQSAGSGIVAGAAGLMIPSAWAQSQAPPRPTWKLDRSKLAEYPTLSLKERDRRWNIARQLMQKNNVECIFVPGGGADNFFTNDASATVFFPLKGEPIALGEGRSYQAASWLTNEERGEVSWVRDWRFDMPKRPPTEVQVLKDLGLEKARIGTIGVSRGGHFSPGGSISAGLWTALQKELPGVTWVELWGDFIVEWLTKSEEELPIFRRAALLGELACQAMMDVTKPGVSESNIYAAIQYAILNNGGFANSLILHSGPDNSSWGAPKWAARAQKPRIIQAGDIICTEIFPYYGHLQAQCQMCVAVGKVADINHKLARTAHEAAETGWKLIRPGITFGELAQQMNQANIREGFWHITPNVHSLNPLESVGPVSEGIRNHPQLRERFPHLEERTATGMDIVIRPGMCFAFETNSHSGRNRVNIGGNVIATKDGCEILNDLPWEMRAVG